MFPKVLIQITDFGSYTLLDLLLKYNRKKHVCEPLESTERQKFIM